MNNNPNYTDHSNNFNMSNNNNYNPNSVNYNNNINNNQNISTNNRYQNNNKNINQTPNQIPTITSINDNIEEFVNLINIDFENTPIVDIVNEIFLVASKKGASERFRAVLMTALTFILGVLPMIFASGPGANSQISIGVTVFFGMIIATTIGIIFIPALFAVFEHIKEYFYKNQKKKHLNIAKGE